MRNGEVVPMEFDVVVNVKPFSGKDARIVFDSEQPPVFLSITRDGEVKIALNHGDYISVPIDEPSFKADKGMEFDRLYVACEGGKLNIANDEQELRIPFDNRISYLHTRSLKYALTSDDKTSSLRTFLHIYLEMGLAQAFNIPAKVLNKFIDDIVFDRFYTKRERLHRLGKGFRIAIDRPYQACLGLTSETGPFIFIDTEFNFVNSSQLGDSEGFIITEEKSEQHHTRSIRLHEKWLAAIYVKDSGQGPTLIHVAINAGTDIDKVKAQVNELITGNMEIQFNESVIKNHDLVLGAYEEPLARAVYPFDWERFNILNKQYNQQYFTTNERRYGF